MKKYCLLLLLVLSNEISDAQNLVPNNGFDIYSTCPTASSQTTLTPPWFEPSGATAQPDYMNGCFNGNHGMPSNFYGYQQSVSDSGYYGMIAYYAGLEVREYMTVQLTSPLTAGVVYNVGLHVSFADNFIYAIDHFGAYLSVGPVTGNGYFALNSYIPQIDNGAGNMITDSANWTYINGLYTAAGGENYITVGNFYNDSSTQVTMAYPSNTLGWAYYYVDEVSVIPDSVTALPENMFINDFTLYPNPFINSLSLKVKTNELTELILYDISSRELIHEEFNSFVSIDTQQLAKGMYLYEVRNKNGVVKKGKVVKE
ncbi:MAG TPA: T9SS type A sorting domain-containing protein [Bacteroidia bacterium]|nr:T9SS type A sorting domain-containing protein [Bacteroidia bacterium]